MRGIVGRRLRDRFPIAVNFLSPGYVRSARPVGNSPPYDGPAYRKCEPNGCGRIASNPPLGAFLAYRRSLAGLSGTLWMDSIRCLQGLGREMVHSRLEGGLGRPISSAQRTGPAPSLSSFLQSIFSAKFHRIRMSRGQPGRGVTVAW